MDEDRQLNTLRLKSIAWLLCLIIFSAPAQADRCQFEPGGIGGTGHTEQDGGIGGTGHEDDNGAIGGTGFQDEPGGIGGTGHGLGTGGIGGTGDLAEGSTIGILGTITEFASICVNGIEVHFNPDTPVQVDGKSATHQSLALGQVAEIIAKNVGNRMIAQSIRINHTISGPITTIDTTGRQLQVLGQTVQFGRRSVVADGKVSLMDPTSLVKGQFVKISGLRTPNGTVIASRIERTGASRNIGIRGTVLSRDGALVSVNGTLVKLRGLAVVSSVRKGNVVSIRGILTANTIDANLLAIQSPIPFGGDVRRVNIEGYLDQTTDRRTLKIGQANLLISDTTNIIGGDESSITSGRRVRISGRLSQNGQIEVDGITLERGFNDRRRLPVLDSPKTSEFDSDNSKKMRGAERSDRTDRSDRGERSERSERANRTERSNRPDAPSRIDRPSRPERAARPERPDRVIRPDRPERIDRPERSGRN